ncbi:uncharacterized protein LOC132561626, partial [Ylistrum balloti]|uniref:uncharacterized protein LOC132561626 n=1 Tax=Ylistrum balloti TaxID=509963 RepID=UPI0029058101
VFLGADQQVQDTKCDCPRGQLKCQHIAAGMIYANKNISRTSVSLLMPEPETKRVKTVEDVFTSKDYLEAKDKSNHLLEKLKVKSNDITHIESVTKGQSESSLWYMYRKGRLTASNFGLVIKATETNRYPASLYKRLLGEYDLSGMKAIQWGKDHESVAVEAFMQSTGLVTRPSGFILPSDTGPITPF